LNPPGRDIELGDGSHATEVITDGNRKRYPDTVSLLERFRSHPARTRYEVRLELGYLEVLAAELFAIVVFCSDGLLQLREQEDWKQEQEQGQGQEQEQEEERERKREAWRRRVRVLRIAKVLPMELQMVLCHRIAGSLKSIVTVREAEMAFRHLAEALHS